jgi:FAD/FMN-containing dehydrogenase
MKWPDEAARFRRALTRTTTARLLACDRLSDFGGVREARPAALVLISNEAEARAALRLAHECGLNVRLRGAGHSVDGQSLGDGVVLVNRAPTAQARMLDGVRVAVSGRTSWADLEEVLNRAGRSAPVLTDYLDLTIGGTLSVGGYGVRSVTAGSQIEHIERVRIVDYTGDARWFGRTDPAFGTAVAGLGRAGLIEEVVMRTIPRPHVTLVETFRHRDLNDLIDALLALGGAAPDQFSAWLTRTDIVSEYGFFGAASTVRPSGGACLIDRCTTGRYPQLVHTERARWLSTFRAHRKVWADFQVPIAGFAAFARRTGRWAREPAFRHLAVRYVLACRAAPPLGTLAPTDGSAGLFAGLGFYFMVPPGDAAALSDARLGIRRCLEACLELGGRPYLYGCVPFHADEALRLYGHEPWLPGATGRGALHGDAHG